MGSANQLICIQDLCVVCKLIPNCMGKFDEIVEDYFGIKSPTKRELYKVIHK